MTVVLESENDRDLSSAELDLQTLQMLFTEQKKRAAHQQKCSEISYAFLQMGRGLKDCRLQSNGDRQEWCATAMAGPRLTGAAETLKRLADSHDTTDVKQVLWSLAAECYHLMGEHEEAAKLAALALSYQQQSVTEAVVAARLAICLQVQAGETLAATTPSDLLKVLQNLILAA